MIYMSNRRLLLLLLTTTLITMMRMITTYEGTRQFSTRRTAVQRTQGIMQGDQCTYHDTDENRDPLCVLAAHPLSKLV